MTQTEALKLARDEIAGLNGDPYYSGRFDDVLQKIDEALAQPEQSLELVEWRDVDGTGIPEPVYRLKAQPEQEPVIKTVWVVGGKTWQQICATQEDVHKLIADMGMNTPSLYPSMSEVPLLSYTTPPQRKPLPKSENSKHKYNPHKKYPWFCADCGYAEHELLMHEAAHGIKE